MHNAKQLGIDLSEVDAVVISHGHYDHGGAVASFLKLNSKAKIYLHRRAFEPYYAKVWFVRKYIGLDAGLKGNERFAMIDGTMRIDDELFIFSDVDGQFDTKSSRMLQKKTGNGYVKDDFAHEHSLIVTLKDKAALFSGCSHRGITNILRAAYKHQPVIQAVFGGFHLYNPATKATEPAEMVERLAKELSARGAVFYTGHCTGQQAFACMRNIMGDKVQYFHTGSTIEL